MMKRGTVLGFMGMVGLLIVLISGTVSAREVITITKANGGSYNITAYNTATRTYYYLNGGMTSDSHRVTVPDGYGSAINVTLGRRVGTRNLYEERDPLNPILEVQKKSAYVLELIYKGHGPSALQAPGVQNFIGGSGPPGRQPPP